MCAPTTPGIVSTPSAPLQCTPKPHAPHPSTTHVDLPQPLPRLRRAPAARARLRVRLLPLRRPPLLPLPLVAAPLRRLLQQLVLLLRYLIQGAVGGDLVGAKGVVVVQQQQMVPDVIWCGFGLERRAGGEWKWGRTAGGLGCAACGMSEEGGGRGSWTGRRQPAAGRRTCRRRCCSARRSAGGCR